MKKCNFPRVLERAIIRVMKKNFLFLGVFFAVIITAICPVWAQSSPLYNTQNSFYNSSGPINLQQVSRGGGTASRVSSNSQYYGGSNARPFGLDNQNFSLGLTSQDIRASRARRDSEARRREQENLTAIQQYDDDLAAFQRQQQANAQQQLQGQRPSGFTSPSTTTGRRSFNNRQQQRQRFEKPRRVFNSLQ